MEYTQREIKKWMKALVRDVAEWNPGKELPREADKVIDKDKVSIDDFWAMRKIYALKGLNVSPLLNEKKAE